MTDASQEGTLPQRAVQHFNKMVSADDKRLDAATSLGEMSVIATLDYLESLGVPLDALEHGRMVARVVCVPAEVVYAGNVTRVHQCNGIHRTEWFVAPTTTTEQAKEGE